MNIMIDDTISIFGVARSSPLRSAKRLPVNGSNIRRIKEKIKLELSRSAHRNCTGFSPASVSDEIGGHIFETIKLAR